MKESAPPNWQQPAENLRKRLWDVVIVGGGPAGATAALNLARAGRTVCVLERAVFPRDKACGDLLIPDSIGALARSGLLDRVRAKARRADEALVSSPGRIDWTIGGEYLAIRRLDLDRILAEGAAREGASVALGRVTSFTPDGGGVRAGLDDGTMVNGRVGILATGADVTLLESIGMLRRREPSSFALRCYVRSAMTIDRVVIAFDRAVIPGYGWIFPMGEDRYNVGVGLVNDGRSTKNLRELFAAFVEGFPTARELMDSASDVSAIRGARLRCGLEGATPVDGPVLAIGETIGTTFPFTGEGIGKAMESAEIASDVIDQGLETGLDALQAYPARVEAALRAKYYGYRVAERWLAYPWLSDMMSRRIRKSPYLRSAAEGIISETTDPRELFSVRGLLKSLWH